MYNRGEFGYGFDTANNTLSRYIFILFLLLCPIQEWSVRNIYPYLIFSDIAVPLLRITNHPAPLRNLITSCLHSFVRPDGGLVGQDDSMYSNRWRRPSRP